MIRWQTGFFVAAKQRLLFLLWLLPASCALGPNYAPPPPPAGAAAPFVSAIPAATSNAPAEADWWRLYNDPVLDSLIAQAFAANTDLQAAEDNLPPRARSMKGRAPRCCRRPKPRSRVSMAATP